MEKRVQITGESQRSSAYNEACCEVKSISRDYIHHAVQGNRTEALKAIIRHVGPYSTKY